MHFLLALVVTIRIAAAAGRHPIDPRVYGLNFASEAQLRDLNVAFNRSGGNATTRYNWEQNATNHASDWYFESLEEGPNTPSGAADDFITATQRGGASAAYTIPMIGWVARLGPHRERLSSFSIAKYGAQQDRDWQWFPDAGNGVHSGGGEIANNDPHDANLVVDPSFFRAWVAHMAGEGLRYYLLDNEPSLWQWTHRDVKPTGATMDEMLARTIDYASMIRDANPNAIMLGPEEWGWLGYLLSGYDQQWADEHQNWSSTPDRMAHGGMDYVPWLLREIRAHEQATGKRLLDVLTVHFYPQQREFSDDDSRTAQLQRNVSTRDLWDASYRDPSWIDANVRLVPRLKEWTAQYAPGLQTGITEYSWGADQLMNGATAQADLLGIFGREGLDLAARWTTPPTGSPVYNAFKLYRNYDGAKSSFGDVSVEATAPQPDEVAAFAAIRTRDNALTIVLINKQLDAEASVQLQLANFVPRGNAQRWQLANGTIARAADVAANATLTLPRQSVTLLVVPGTKVKRRAVR
ncbi:MAG: glycoside hydrolase family 44 protein [Acidobacteria bacterium]|nr:glycoside hydrolase family 44 protein [Acidobacteriota bacterium]MBV9475853.1 glycoside hydrolase family 44 protein [Acidobacteriota bacterium]